MVAGERRAEVNLCPATAAKAPVAMDLIQDDSGWLARPLDSGVLGASVADWPDHSEQEQELDSPREGEVAG